MFSTLAEFEENLLCKKVLLPRVVFKCHYTVVSSKEADLRLLTKTPIDVDLFHVCIAESYCVRIRTERACFHWCLLVCSCNCASSLQYDNQALLACEIHHGYTHTITRTLTHLCYALSNTSTHTPVLSLRHTRTHTRTRTHMLTQHTGISQSSLSLSGCQV